MINQSAPGRPPISGATSIDKTTTHDQYGGQSSFAKLLRYRSFLPRHSYDAGRLSFKDRFCFAIAAYLEFGTYYQPWQVPTAYLIFVPAWNNSHHDSKVYKVKGYLSSKVGRYPNSASTFQMFNHQWSYL